MRSGPSVHWGSYPMNPWDRSGKSDPTPKQPRFGVDPYFPSLNSLPLVGYGLIPPPPPGQEEEEE